MKRSLCLLLPVLMTIFLVPAIFAQAKKKPVKKPVKKSAAAKTVKPEPAATTTSGASTTSTVPAPAKKNDRPGAAQSGPMGAAKTPVKPNYPYFYEFTQPAFDIDHILIEHDDSGKGTVTFSKRDYNESYTDPIQLTAVTMQKLKGWWSSLNFLDSTENYQSERQYGHLGTIKLRLRQDKRERTVEINWSENKDVKALMDEYRNLGHQYVWMFNMVIARENQPLEAPKMIDALAGMLRRGEISDPQQMVPLLKELSEEERIPLVARNQATKLLQQIEKEKK